MAQGKGSSQDTSKDTIGSSPSLQTIGYAFSPSKVEVDESSLQKSMDQNKESLKVKLMLRRPISQLVSQGIMPQYKTSPSIHEQCQKLERAKMGDLLKAKIQQRPNRQELIRQHILEDVGNVDPSLAERQKMLKKCKLADALNNQLSHRPGPLELIKKNILHTEEYIERAVKEGRIEFKATSEGQKKKTELPVVTSNVNLFTTASNTLTSYAASSNSSPLNSVALSSTVSNAVFAYTTPIFCTALKHPLPVHQPQPSASKDRTKKKSKSKGNQQKTRTIKFHEYKGPPNALKNNNNSNSSNSNTNSLPKSETSYELLLQQQQLFLQWQLEWQQKYPHILLPISQKVVNQNSLSSSIITISSSTTSSSSQPEINQSDSSSSCIIPSLSSSLPLLPTLPLQSDNNISLLDFKLLKNSEDMQGVNTANLELDSRNVYITDQKPQILQKLKLITVPLNEDTVSEISNFSSISEACQINSSNFVDKLDDLSHLNSLSNENLDATINIVKSNNIHQLDKNIVYKQPEKTEKSKNQHHNSAPQLLPKGWHQPEFQTKLEVNPKVNLDNCIPEQELIASCTLQQQNLDNLVQQQRIQQLETNNFNNIHTITKKSDGAKKINNNANQNNSNSRYNIVNNGLKENQKVVKNSTNLMVNHADSKANLSSQRTTSLPNFVGTFIQPQILLPNQDSVVCSNDYYNALCQNITVLNNKYASMVSDEAMNNNSVNNIEIIENSIPQNEDIPKLFNQENIAHEMIANDGFNLLMANEDFNSPQSKSILNTENSDLAVISALSNIDHNLPSQHLSLEELGIDMETFPMDLCDDHSQTNVKVFESMDVDSDWLDRLISSKLVDHSDSNSLLINGNKELMLNNNNLTNSLNIFNLNDSDFLIPAECSQDIKDFTT